MQVALLAGLLSTAVDAQLVRPVFRESTTAWRAAAAPRAQPAASPGEQARERWQRVDDIVRALNIGEGSTVADVGAGGGFFTLRLARIVGPSGRVYAVDINRDVLTKLRDRAAAEGLQNVETIQSEPDDPRLPYRSLDAALIVNAYHEMTAYELMLQRLRQALKPNGRLVLVEPMSDARRDGSREEQIRRHQIAPEFVTREARTAGFDILGLEDPFTIKPQGDEIEWLLALRPTRQRPATTPTSAGAPPTSRSAAAATAASESETAWKDPALRISLDEVKRLITADGVVILDVRDAESYKGGHIPGARLIPLEDVERRAAELRSLQKPIVTYCS
jgi:predicted methyltransferase